MNEESKKVNETISELIPDIKTIKSTSGVDITLPILYKGHNLMMNKLLNELIDPKNDTLLALVNESDETKINKLYELMAIYTGKPVEWLDENFSIEDVVAELQLFFGVVRYAKTTKKLQEFQKMVLKLIPSGK